MSAYAGTNWNDVEAAAVALTGNFRRFTNFAYFGDKDASWAIVYTHNRDSGLLDQSNAAAIAKALARFPDDVVEICHSHWAVGYVDGFELRVYATGGAITPAFATYCELQARLDDYPVLDEDDYSEREREALYENVCQGLRMSPFYFSADEADAAAEGVIRWLWNHDPGAIDNRDDQGGYPNDDELAKALEALGYSWED
jgi:hypothetical protein